MIIWPGGLPGDCWQMCDTYSRCDEQDDDLPNWNDGSPADAPWRAASYERAATRPCTDLPLWTLGGRRARVCFNTTAYGKRVRLDSSCGGTSWCTK